MCSKNAAQICGWHFMAATNDPMRPLVHTTFMFAWQQKVSSYIQLSTVRHDAPRRATAAAVIHGTPEV